MRYFDHDTNAADDDGIMSLRLEHGGAAVDCYWALLEKIYRDEKPLNLFGTDGGTNRETDSVSHRLCIGSETLKKYVLSMLEIGLLDGTVENVYSERAMANIEKYQAKAIIARQNGKKGGRKPSAKPRRNRAGSEVGTDAETKTLTRKENKGIGSDKQNLYLYSAGADAVGTAPPECDICGAKMQRTNSTQGGKTIYRCSLCGEEALR